MCMLTVAVHDRLGYLPHGFVHRGMKGIPVLRWLVDGLGFLTADGDDVARAVARGEHIVVTPGVAQKMSQPRDAQGRPIRVDVKTLDPKAAAAAASGAQAAAPSDEGDTATPDKPKRPVRAVGPTFVPAR